MVLWCSLECTPACQAGGRGFKSRQDRCFRSGPRVTPAVADLANQIPSAPFAPAIQEPEHGRVAQLAERAPEKREVTGSMPVPTTRNSQLERAGNP